MTRVGIPSEQSCVCYVLIQARSASRSLVVTWTQVASWTAPPKTLWNLHIAVTVRVLDSSARPHHAPKCMQLPSVRLLPRLLPRLRVTQCSPHPAAQLLNSAPVLWLLVEDAQQGGHRPGHIPPQRGQCATHRLASILAGPHHRHSLGYGSRFSGEEHVQCAAQFGRCLDACHARRANRRANRRLLHSLVGALQADACLARPR